MAGKNSIKCRRCDRRYSRIRHKCPYCGAKKKGNSKRAIYDTTPKWQLAVSAIILIAVAVVVAVLIIMSVTGNSSTKDKNKNNDKTSTSDNINTGADGVNDVENNSQNDVEVTAITIDHTGIEMSTIGEQVTITATVTPAGADAELEWVSSDDSVCMVSSAGVVTAVGNGTATVYVQSGSVKSHECAVKVEIKPATNPVLSHTDVTISSASSESFTLSVSGNEGTPTYTVDNSSVATVTDSGKVTAVSSGTTTVKVTVDGQTLECIVRVN